MMDHSALARRLDGRSAAVVVRSFCRGPELAQQIWAAGLYGYRLERHDPGAVPGLAGPRLHFVLDPDPAARRRAAWMRRPDLRPGVLAPVRWGTSRVGEWPPVWTPPGWPPGHGPVPPADGDLPSAPWIAPWRTRLSPGNIAAPAGFVVLVRTLAALGVTRSGRAVAFAAWDIGTAFLVAALLTGALVARRVRNSARRAPGT
ncbi:hypothetical protein ACFV4M_38640 [Kitasatospora indigofera]|uniref:hypothetical protein n=1 Tax=Kitasatospora indigofera TaxID=67307 RepID=UPI00365E23B7